MNELPAYTCDKLAVPARPLIECATIGSLVRPIRASGRSSDFERNKVVAFRQKRRTVVDKRRPEVEFRKALELQNEEGTFPK